MAGHLPIKTKTFHINKVKEFKEMVGDIKSEPFYKKRKTENGGCFFRLSNEYFMDEEHGMVDDIVISYTPPSMACTYEIHLDKNEKINKVYLVM